MARGTMARIAVLTAMGLAATAASAQTTTADKPAEARLAWAKRHVELVCRPLEARQMFDKATRCYNDVARIVSDASKTLPTAEVKPAAPAEPVARPASRTPPAVRAPVRTAAPAPAVRTRIIARQVVPPVYRPVVAVEPSSPRRCSGVSCLQFTSLGVGF